MRRSVNKVIGNIGEAMAVDYLKKKKYKILETNYSCRFGEIDIIAKDGKCFVFVEVKARNGGAFGAPIEAVDTRKQKKIRSVANFYLQKIDNFYADARFDVIEVYDETNVNHVIDAFR